MKILVSLSSYGNKNLHYLNSIVDEYKSYKKYDIFIDVHCTVPIERTDINQIIHENPSTTSLFHRKDFIEKQNDYDLFIFSEYDMLIREHCIDTFLKYDKLLPIDYCLGFIRYENTPENEEYLIDLWKNISGYNYIHSVNNEYFEVSNVHQACYVLTKEKLKFVIQNSDFDIDTLSGNGPEMASSGIFKNWPIGPKGLITKVLPKNKDIDFCFIHHMADCHCNPPGVNSDYMTFRNNTITKKLLFQDLNL